MWAREQIYEKYQNGYHLKTISQNKNKSNQHIVGINVNVHTKYEVSMTYLCGQESKSKKNTKNGCHLKATNQNH